MYDCDRSKFYLHNLSDKRTLTVAQFKSQKEVSFQHTDKKSTSFPLIHNQAITKVTNLVNYHSGIKEKALADKNISLASLSTKSDLKSQPSTSNLPSETQKEAFLIKCFDKKNSKAIQTWLETTNEEQTDFAFSMISDNLMVVCKHVFGNYVLQKFIEKGTKNIRSKVLHFFKGKVLELSTNSYACRVIQAYLESTKRDNNSIGQHFIVSELKDFVLKLVYDHSGNHVIQKLAEMCSLKVLEPIVQQVNLNVDKMAFHSFGSRVIQKILDRYYEAPEKVDIGRISEFSLEMTFSLSKCQNGNYIIQHMLEKGSDYQKINILNVLKDNFLELSMDKFASNVTQKSLLLPCPSYQTLIIDSLITNTEEDPFNEPIVTLMTSTYGNYVVQSLYKHGHSELKTKILNFIVQNPETMERIRRSAYGKHVMSFVEKVLMSSGKEQL